MTNLINSELKDPSFAILGSCLLTCYVQCSLGLHCRRLNLIQDLVSSLSRLYGDGLRDIKTFRKVSSESVDISSKVIEETILRRAS